MSPSDTESDVVPSIESAHRGDECPYLDEQTALFGLIGKTHTNEILRELILEPEPQRFNELRERLKYRQIHFQVA